MGGNYFAFRITAPAEYSDVPGAAENVVFRDSIERAGGFVLKEEAESGTNCKSVTIAFKAENNVEIKPFEITWEPGNTETFRVEIPDGLLMEDVSRAVAPKSMAFNGAMTKMAVGEVQQLDLKLAKAQMEDVICIAYESDNEDVLLVSDSGYVTAISTGKASVTAYAAYRDDADEGKIVPIKDAKGNYAKSARVNITVNSVSEVKGIKFEAYDVYAYIDYNKVPDGYRREVYVLEGTGRTLQEFESEIAKGKDGNYGNFVDYQIITAKEYPRGNVSLATGKKYWGTIRNLKPNKQYSVYVRNVSVTRRYVDGKEITLKEYYSGKTISRLTTTKTQESGLCGYFDSKVQWGQTAYGEGLYIDISAKRTQFYVDALYHQVRENGSDGDGDYVWLPQKLNKEQQKTYTAPKLTYFVQDAGSRRPTRTEPADWQNQGYVKTGSYYYIPSTIATMDKSGRLTLKGTGQVRVYAYDQACDRLSGDSKEALANENGSTLTIKADVNAITGKPVKMKVGETVFLRDYITYKQGNVKFSGYDNVNLQIARFDDPEGAFEVTPVSDRDGRTVNYKITAKKPVKGALELAVTDETVLKNTQEGAKVREAVIKIQSAVIDPVKNLKAYNVYDTTAGISFDYGAKAGDTDSDVKFRIERSDMSGKVKELYLAACDNEGYNAKKKTYSYKSSQTGLSRLSSYTITVTAVYGDYESKPVKIKIKTTNIPASDIDVVARNTTNGVDSREDDGCEVGVYRAKNGSRRMLSAYPLIKSGNTYTLEMADGVSETARIMKSDTLTWKSSNTKTATVKANAGTFTAALKALNRGNTQITVTSKITKKVIAR